jgi:hypothetical protein
MKKLIVGLTGLCLCSTAWAAGLAPALRDYAITADVGTVVNDTTAQRNGKIRGEAAPTIGVGAPANDECAGRITIPCNTSIVADNTGATTNPNDPLFTCQNGTDTQGHGTIWYQFTPTAAEARISTCVDIPGSGGDDSLLQAFSGSCASLTLLGCSDDANCGATTFQSDLLLPNLTVGVPVIIELAGWDPSVEGAWNLDVDCNLSGACCNITTLVCSQLNPGACFDSNGVFLGTDVPCGQFACAAAPTCPGGAIIENEPSCGQPSPDSFNAGCAAAVPAFTFLSGDGCGSVICATSSADLRNGGTGGRDTDWFFFTPSETQNYTATVVAQFFAEVGFWELTPGLDPCALSIQRNLAFGDPGTNVTASRCILRDIPFAIRVTTVDANGEAQRIGIACASYRLSIACSDCDSGACCVGSTCVANFYPSGPYAGELVNQVNCEAQGGVYQGNGATCDGVVCTAPCCLPNGSCGANMSRTECVGQGGVWFEGATMCSQVEPCPVCIGEDPMDLDGAFGDAEDCTILPNNFVNDGCTADAPGTQFTPLACGQTVCGAAVFDNAFRDLDWFHLNIPSLTEAMITIDNSTDAYLIFLIRWYPQQASLPACDTTGAIAVYPESGTVPPGTNQVGPRERFVQPMVFTPGRYTLMVAYDFRTLAPAVLCPDDSGPNYRVGVACSTTACSVTRNCQANENEAACGDPTQANLGCAANPVGPRTSLPLNTKMCGDVRLVRTTTGLTRDIDTYLVNIPTTGDYVFRIEAAFHALVFLTPLPTLSDCSQPDVFGFLIYQCGAIPYDSSYDGVEIEVTGLEAGNYEILITPDFIPYRTLFIGAFPGDPAAGEICPSPYELEVTSGGTSNPCAGIICGDSNLSGSISVGDIGAFVTAVSQGFAAWDALIPGAQTMDEFICANDTDGGGTVSVGDIGLFVASVTAGSSQCAP